MPNEKRVPSVLAKNTHGNAMGLSCSGEQILDKKIPLGGLFQKIAMQGVELSRHHRFGIVPPDGAFGFRIAHHKFVGGGAPRVRPGDHGKAACRGYLALSPPNRLLVKGCERTIVKQSITHVRCRHAIIIVDSF